ncbi:MAG TPA: DUF2304 domain-containing protein [Anaeromyxobacteraceae bacterium]|nr:DUF2304 domain-containing protein [Anaeromyxobacteraceae bacterium]
MNYREAIPLEQQVLSVLALGTFLLWVFHLVRTQRLSLRDSLLWVVTTLVAAVFAVFPPVLFWLSKLLGFRTPSNALFGGAVLYLTLNVLYNTVSGSLSAARVRRLTQECAMLRAEIEAMRRDRSRPGAAT